MKKIYSPFGGKLVGTFEYTTSKDIKIILDSLKSGVKTQKNISYRAEHLPFGGVKDSGIGREGIRYAMEEMSVLKNLIL